MCDYDYVILFRIRSVWVDTPAHNPTQACTPAQACTPNSTLWRVQGGFTNDTLGGLSSAFFYR